MLRNSSYCPFSFSRRSWLIWNVRICIQTDRCQGPRNSGVGCSKWLKSSRGPRNQCKMEGILRHVQATQGHMEAELASTIACSDSTGLPFSWYFWMTFVCFFLVKWIYQPFILLHWIIIEEPIEDKEQRNQSMIKMSYFAFKYLNCQENASL